MEYKYLVMEVNMRVHGKIILEMEKVSIIMMMESSMKENFSSIEEKDLE
jgi:hypothetical protein